MKYKIFILSMILLSHFTFGCPVCEKQQPKITQGFTHGPGPQNNWDWIIVASVSVITVLTFIYSVKYLIKPGEKNSDHIKQSILGK